VNISSQLLSAVAKPLAAIRSPLGNETTGQDGNPAMSGAFDFASLMKDGALSGGSASADIMSALQEFENTTDIDIPEEIMDLVGGFSDPARLDQFLETNSQNVQAGFGGASGNHFNLISSAIQAALSEAGMKGSGPSVDQDIGSELTEEIPEVPLTALNQQSPVVSMDGADLADQSEQSAELITPVVAASSRQSAMTGGNDLLDRNGSPTFFRPTTGNTVASNASGQDVLANFNNLQGRGSSVLELFNLRAQVAGNTNQPSNGTGAGLTGPSSNSAIPANVLNNMLGNQSSVAINQTGFNSGTQIPVVPLSTVPGLSNHVLMQVHPAITERANAIESSLITPSPVRAGKSIELQLVPRSLGVVDMKIVNQNGIIRISIETETVEAQRLIRSEVSGMMESFRSAGLKLEDFTVTHNSRLDAANQGERDGRGESQSFNQQQSANDASSRQQAYGQDGAEHVFTDGTDGAGKDAATEVDGKRPERQGLYL
jgi:flagellar hook-length control protein FliK